MAMFDEGQNTRKNDDYVEDAATSKWLIDNKLNHLIAVFATENITIDVLMDMNNDDELSTFLDDLVDDNTIKKFKKRDKLRIMSKLKSKNKPQPKTQQIITEAEMSALDSLNKKYKQLSLTTQSIEERLNEFEKEYIKQQKILNNSFNQILSIVETRRNALLNQMKQKRDEYKHKLGKRMQSVANQRSLLDQIKSKCENDINNSGVTSLQDAKKRANKTVKLIDETLLSVEQHFDDSKINNGIYVKFDISETVNNDIKQWGNVKIIGDKPPVPIVNFVEVSCQSITIEMLCDEHFTTMVSKYEYQRSPFNTEPSNANYYIQRNNYMTQLQQLQQQQQYIRMQQQQQYIGMQQQQHNNTQFGLYRNDNIFDQSHNISLAPSNDSKENEQNITIVLNNNNNNIVFSRINELQTSTTYKIRVRAVVNDVCSNWSKWFSVNTKNARGQQQPRIIPWPHKHGQFPLQKQSVNMDEWYQLCNEKNTSLSLYQSQRVFYFGLFIEKERIIKSQIRKNEGTVPVQWFQSFIHYIELHCEEWKQFKQNVREIYK